MKSIYALGVVVLLLATSGCSTLKVQKETDENRHESVPGIPFFAKKRIYEHETVLSSSIYAITISYTLIDPTDPSKKKVVGTVGSVTIPQSMRNGALMMEIYDLISKVPSQTSADFSEIDRTFVGLREKIEQIRIEASKTSSAFRVGGLPDDGECTITSNRLRQTIVADTEFMYFVNGRVPLIGSGVSSFELQPDLTLTKAASTVEDKTTETILAALPLTEYFKKQWALTADQTPPADDVVAFNVFQSTDASQMIARMTPRSSLFLSVDVTIKPVTTLYILTRQVDNPSGFAAPLKLSDAKTGANLVQIETKQVGEPEKKAEPEKPMYKFQGEVALPEAKPTS